MPSNLELCDQLFSAIRRADIEAVRGIYAPDAVIWHNNDGVEEDPDRNLRVLSWVARNIKDLRYEEIRRQETSTGFVQQHVLLGIAPNGTALEIPACIVCEVKDGRITRLDEYLDSAHTAPLRS
ncbi:MAG: nuclear transport factor 2 family protein [Dehalococcoidia bacterium]